MEPITVMSWSNWIPTGYSTVKGVRETPLSKTWTFTIYHPEPEDRDKLLQSPYQYLIMTRDQETFKTMHSHDNAKKEAIYDNICPSSSSMETL
jgi:hypothetical protein